MQLLKRNLTATSGFLWVALLCLLIQSGCASVEHIRLYREARQDFSAAAREDNNLTANNLFPDPSSFKDLYSSSNPTASDFSLNQAQESMGRWDAVLREFQALNRLKKKELLDDQLLGSSQTLQILAQLRRDLWTHFLESGGGQLAYPENVGPSKSSVSEQSKPPLTAALAQAETLAANKEVKLFDRDAFLLKSLRPMVRYEIAYINASRPYIDGNKSRVETFLPIAEQMVLAEKELEEISSTDQRNLQSYITMSRYIMLVSARYVVASLDKGKVQLPLDLKDENDKKRYDSSQELKKLHERVNHFQKQAETKDTPEQKLINSLGVTSEKLGGVGLGPIVKAGQ